MLTLALAFATLAAQAQPADAGCNAAAPKPITQISVPGRPFGIAITEDGCAIFVAVNGHDTGVAVLDRREGKIKLQHVIHLEGNPTELALSHDGKLLAVADASAVAFLDPQKTIAGSKDAVLGYLNENSATGNIFVAFSPDDKFLFVSQERARNITVVDVAKALSSNFSLSAIVGRIPTGNAPIAVVFSADQKLIYTTSEVIGPEYSWPDQCEPEAQGRGGRRHPEGAVIVADLALAETHPEKSVRSVIPAGCSPVRMAISPAGDFIYVTARNSNTMFAFRTDKLVTDASHSAAGSVPVGSAPVPVTVADSGAKILVGNSNRFAGRPGQDQDITVIDAARVSEGKAAVIGRIPAGAFPREFATSADGRTVALSNFASESVEIIDVGRLPELKKH